jgi:hypothetical protein
MNEQLKSVRARWCWHLCVTLIRFRSEKRRSTSERGNSSRWRMGCHEYCNVIIPTNPSLFRISQGKQKEASYPSLFSQYVPERTAICMTFKNSESFFPNQQFITTAISASTFHVTRTQNYKNPPI